MKKLISFVLAIALVLGCVGVISFVQAEGEQYVGVKVDNFNSQTDQNHIVFYTILGGIDATGENATITLTVNYTNPSNQKVWLTLKPCNGTSWVGSATDLYTPIAATGNTSVGWVNPGDEVELTATIPSSAVNGDLAIDIVVGVENGASLSADAEFIFSSNANIIPDGNKYMGGTWVYPCTGDVTPLTAAQMPGGAPAETEDTALTLTFTSGGTDNQIYFYDVTEGLDISGGTATLKVKITNTNRSGRAWFAIVPMSKSAWTPITATGTDYQEIGQGGSYEFVITFDASLATSDLVLKLHITTLPGEDISAGTVLNVVSNANICPSETKSDGGVFIHQCTVNIEETVIGEPPVLADPVGVKLNVNALPGEEGTVHINNTTTISDAMVSGGVVTFKTTIYNPNNHDITIGVQLLNGWTPISATAYQEVIVPANTKKNVTVQANLSETTNGVKEEVAVRYMLVAGYQAGDQLIFTAENATTGFFDVANWWIQKTGNTAETVTEVPNLQDADAEIPAPPQNPVGIKMTVNVAPGDNKTVHINNTTAISDAMISGGVVTVTTTVYNPNNHEVTIRLQLLNGWDGIASDPYGEATIPANSKETFTAKVNLSEVTPASKESLNIRYVLMSGCEAGDTIYFTVENPGAGFYDAANWYIQEPSNTVETVTELPELQAPAPTEKPIATKIKYTANVDATESRFHVPAVNSDTIKVKFFNLGKEDIQMFAQVMNEWAVFTDNPYQFFTVPAEDSIEVELKTNLDNGAVTKDKVALRFSVMQAVTAGTEIIVQFIEPSGITVSGDWWVEHADSIEIKGIATVPQAEKRIPTGVEFTAKEDVVAGESTFATSVGIITSADVKDDVLTKTFKIKNTGDVLFLVKYELQALVKDDNQNDTWMSPHASEYVAVAPGETKELTYEVDIDGGGTVEIYSQDVPYENLFARFDFMNVEGQNVVDKDTQFVIYGSEADINFLRTMIFTAQTKWSTKVIYSATSATTGDVLPVAIIASTMFALALLVVVSKKKKEN